MSLSENKQFNNVKSPSPMRVINYQSPTLPKTTCKLLYQSHEISSSNEFNQISLKPDKLKSLNITCLNCQRMIHPEQVEKHSLQCTSMSAEILNLEEGCYLNELLYKIEKLEDCLNDLNLKLKKTENKTCIQILLKYCRACKTQNLPNVRDSLQSLDAWLSAFRGTISIRVYADRLQSLMVEIVRMVEEKEIETTRYELDRIKNQVEKYKIRTEMIKKGILNTTSSARVKNLVKKVEEVKNDGNCGASTHRVFNENNENDPDELKKVFYSLCLALKMKMPKRKRSANLNAQKLFNEATRLKIEPEKWYEFISKKLLSLSNF